MNQTIRLGLRENLAQFSLLVLMRMRETLVRE